MLTVWGRKTSSNVQALMWCVAELDLDYQRIDIGHRYGGNNTPPFLAMNPNGTVPVLQDEENTPMWETGAILRYLAARYAPDSFWPADVTARAGVDQWAEWAKLNVALNFTAPLFWPLVRTPAAERDATAIAHSLARLHHFLTIADRQLEKAPFLTGTDFSLADIQFGHVLYRYFDLPLAHAVLPAVAAYYARLCQRPAFRQHVMISYEELRAE